MCRQFHGLVGLKSHVLANEEGIGEAGPVEVSIDFGRERNFAVVVGHFEVDENVRHDADAWQADPIFDGLDARHQQRAIAAEFVDEESADQRALFRFEQRHRADD